MIVQLLLAIFLVTSATGAAVSVEPRPPVPKEADPNETFALIKELAAPELWVLSFSDGKMYILESKDYPYFSVRSETESGTWKLVNREHWSTIDAWNIGDEVIIFPVIAESGHSKQMVGYMLFSYNDFKNGYWITNAIHP